MNYVISYSAYNLEATHHIRNVNSPQYSQLSTMKSTRHTRNVIAFSINCPASNVRYFYIFYISFSLCTLATHKQHRPIHSIHSQTCCEYCG